MESSVTEKDNQPSVTFKVFFVLFFFYLWLFTTMRKYARLTENDRIRLESDLYNGSHWFTICIY